MAKEIRETGQNNRPAWVVPRPRPDFVNNTTVQALTRRGMAFLKAGFPLHLRGPAGTGKTTLALHMAAQLGRPVIMITGDQEMGTADLVGNQGGYRYHKVVDRFIHSVTKLEETAQQHWADHRLTTACRQGFTLVYDEFTRSRPESNNVLLSVFEERLLVLPVQNREESYIKVHPEFHAIFTSNPQEYAGVHASQDALIDRLVTVDVSHPDRTTEISITSARSGLEPLLVARIVDLVRAFRDSGGYDHTPTMRTSIIIARVTIAEDLAPSCDCPEFVQLYCDVLESKWVIPLSVTLEQRQDHERRHKTLLALIRAHCPPVSPAASQPAPGEGCDFARISPFATAGAHI